MQSDSNWYLEVVNHKQVVTLSALTIVHICLYVSSVTDTSDIPRSCCNRKQTKNKTPRCSMCISDANHNYVIDEILHQQQIYFDRHFDKDDKYDDDHK